METTYKSYHRTMMEEVEVKSKLEIAKNLLGKMVLPDIAQVTGLPLSEIEKLSPTT